MIDKEDITITEISTILTIKEVKDRDTDKGEEVEDLTEEDIELLT